MAPAAPTRILLIEDVAATAEIVEAYLKAASGAIHVMRVESLGGALEQLATGPFDLIIADLNLPDSEGLATLERLAQSTDRLIIVLTIENDPGLEETAIARGAYDFLHKSQLSRANLGRIVRLATMQANTFAALQHANARLEQLALHDPLTGLANRRKLAERFQYDLARTTRTQSPLSLLIVDIDHFKAINDQHGHAAGDACLRALAATLLESVRAVDLVARYGGEEFVVLLPEMTAEQSLVAAERLRFQVQARPFSIGENIPPVAITVSVGAASAEGVPVSLEDLLARADGAVYRAKRAGRNQVRGCPAGEP